MSDYHDHYLKKDVLLLVDVFERFIRTCLKYYELDPCHYFSSPRFCEWKDLFDFSNYSKGSIFYDESNKKVVGIMKDEYGGNIMDEVIGLKSKMYSIKKIGGSESSTAKGVNIATEFNEFKDVLFNKKVIRHKMKRIQAKKHKIGTYEIDKISLSCFDDKRQVLDDRVIEFIL